MPLRPSARLVAAAALACAGAACDDPPLREGAPCTAARASRCASAYCLLDVCTRPEADVDGDGVSNAIELAAGLDPGLADSDRDGEADGREVGPAGVQGGQPFDCDGDGRIDALERQVHTPSESGDADGDGVFDEWDADDAAPLCGGDAVPVLLSETEVGCRSYGCRDKTHCELRAEAPPRDDVRAHCAGAGGAAGGNPRAGRDATCDGVDDDCDGRVDEECDADCDGIDDDCDGLPDDDFGVPDCDAPGRRCTEAEQALSQGWSCVPQGPDQAACLGRRVCERAVETCVVRRLSTIDASCDGVDDDCDGQIDEEYRPRVCGFGVCRAQTTCVQAAESCPTDGEHPPDPETECNGLDDDCDGLVDEGFDPAAPDLADACPAASCGAPPTCTLQGLRCPPRPPDAPARDVTCDGVDDDCDGAVDEDWPDPSGGGAPARSCGDPACPAHAARCEGGEEVCPPPARASGGDPRDVPGDPDVDIVTWELERDGLRLTAVLSVAGDIPADDEEADVAYEICLDNAPEAGAPEDGCDLVIGARIAPPSAWSCAAWAWDAQAGALRLRADVLVECREQLEDLTLVADLTAVSPACGDAHLRTRRNGLVADGLAAPIALP